MLVAFYKQQPASLEAGVKYLVQNAAGSALVLIGIALVFSQTGTLDLYEIHSTVQAHNTSVILVAGMLFLTGFGVKTALVPLHTWLPDAHSQAPSGISAMLSGVVIEAGLIALLRAVGSISTDAVFWGGILLGFGALNMLVGNLMALRQEQVKRLLAFSSVSHMGYILIGIGFALVYQQQNGAGGAMFHIFNHAVMKGLAFLAAGGMLYTLFLANQSHSPLTVKDLAGASQRYPALAFCLSLSVLALGGLPPLAGFMSKWQIFVGGVETQDPWLIAIVLFAAVNSLLSLGYYAPLVNTMYRHQPSAVVKMGKKTTGFLVFPLILLVVLTVLFGFLPSLANGLVDPAANSLLELFMIN